ncbi:MFS transporter [Georgenia sp. Z1344]|uniref:MFS transporter n=1 Tax=Georgenia sp. Z1344 TaxID=3416706 RepID=UPI003CF32427
MLSTARRNFALFTLALGGFGIGTTEFVTMGLLPQIAGELVPGFGADPTAGIAHAGWLVTAYALGVVVGAPVTAVATARMSQRTLVLVLVAALAAANLASALMPGFGLTAVARFVAGLPHGAYFGVASLLAARLMGPGRQGAGVAIALSGLTVANVVGVPLGTWLGQEAGWRWAYVTVAAIFALTLVLALRAIPAVPGNPDRHPSRELLAFRNPRLWLMLAVGAIGFGGFFAVYSYISEVATRTAGLSESLVPWVLATLGTGMVVGNIIGGWASDRDLSRTVVVGFSGLTAAMALYALLAWHPVLLFVLVLAIGITSSSLIPSVQARIIDIAGEAELLGAALNHAAFNVGNSLGAWLGGLVIAGGFGYLAPGWVGVALAVSGGVLALVSIHWDRVSPRPGAVQADEPQPATT